MSSVVAERFLSDFSSNWDFPAISSFGKIFNVARQKPTDEEKKWELSGHSV